MSISEKANLVPIKIAELVSIANQFDSSIHIEQDDKVVNVKSIMGMMGLGITTGTEFKVTADGEDESRAIEKIEQYVCALAS